MWDVGLAKMLKERDPKSLIGPCVGTVISVEPLKIEILNSDVILSGKRLYIPQSLLKKKYKIELKSDTEMGDTEVTRNIGDITITRRPSSALISLNIDKKDKTELILYFELEEGDKVLLIPAENEQTFFIIDIVEKVGE